MSSMVMAKIVNAALKAKAWTFEAKAIGPKAKAKTIKIGLEAKAWPRGLHHWYIRGSTDNKNFCSLHS